MKFYFFLAGKKKQKQKQKPKERLDLYFSFFVKLNTITTATQESSLRFYLSPLITLYLHIISMCVGHIPPTPSIPVHSLRYQDDKKHLSSPARFPLDNLPLKYNIFPG